MTLNDLQNDFLVKRKVLQNLPQDPVIDPDEAFHRFILHADYVAALLTYRDASNYIKAVENWNLNYKAQNYNENTTNKMVGPRPVPPPSWTRNDVLSGKSYTDYGSGPPLIDEVPYPVQSARKSDGDIVFGIEVPGWNPKAFYAAKFVDGVYRVTTVGEGTEAVGPDGETYVLTNIGGIFGSTRIWIRR